MKFVLIVLASLLALANCQTITSNCPSGEYFGYVSTAYTQNLSPVTGLSTTSSNYAPNGIYKVTASNGADQCCYNCATQTGGKCTTWTYDGCGNCYLSSATGSSNYLTTNTASTCSRSVCSGFASGFVSNSSSSSSTTTAATTTTATTTTTTALASCQVVIGQNSPNTADTQISAPDASTCCNKCGATAGCVGFAFLTGTTACWLKTYNPTGASNIQNYPGMIIGGLAASG